MADAQDTTFDAIDEAAAQWVVRLGDGAPNTALREAFEGWLGQDARHAEAFERVHGVWTGAAEAGRRWRDRLRTRVVGAVLALVLAVLPFTLMLRDPVYETRRGERETVQLEDGTRLTLNTDSRLSVHYARDQRRVTLNRGEVYFDVAHNAQRPFVVEVDRDRVRVLGTSFLVRRDGDAAQVALVSGSVMVTQGGAAGLSAPPVTLAPGERVRWRPGAPSRIDRPKLDAYLAWRRGELVLDETPVAEAVAEMNRYARSPMILADPRVGRARISGVFKTGDTEAFAQTLARLYGLSLERKDGRTVLERRPR